MPARMWRHGIHSFLELLRHRLSGSLEHMLTFVSRQEWAYLAAACGQAQMPISVARNDDVMAGTWNPEPGQCAYFHDDPRGMAGEWKEMVGRWNAFAEELWENDDMLSSKMMIYD